MKKKILAMAIALLALGAVSASAQTTGKSKMKNDKKTEQSKKSKSDKMQCDQACDSAVCPFDEMMLFEGITLTEDQKTQLKALKPEGPRGERRHKQDAGQQVAQNEQAKACDGAQCGKCDKANCEKGKCDKACGGKDRGQRPDPRKARAEYLNNVKQILTPDQYVIFLENVATVSPMHHERGMRPYKGQKMEKRQRVDKADKARKTDKVK